MKKDAEVSIYMRERKKGHTQQVAAARAGISERTARKYEQSGQLPSQSKKERSHRTRADPFDEDWPWIVQELERDPALQATTLFALAVQKRPDHYRPTQVRTLQRHIALWRALHGPAKEVIFEQVHQPGLVGQSDFTHMADLQITLKGQPFEHLLYHFVLTYSNVEAVRICFSESFEALAEGLEGALWQLGGVPRQHRTDHLSAALGRLDRQGREDFTARYQALLDYYALQPTTNNTGIAHENGDVEQSHFRFKAALDQALRVRGSRDFEDRAGYERFLNELVRQRNLTRQARFKEEQALLQPLPLKTLAPSRQMKVRVSRFSTIQVLGNTYSVPSRLIGVELTVKVRAETIEGFVGQQLAFSFTRLVGRKQHAINYRHLIWSLVRKPGAFAAYRYRDEFFPSLLLRKAYDLLIKSEGGASGTTRSKADAEYLKILHLAATTSESEVEAALELLLEGGKLPSFGAVRELVASVTPQLAHQAVETKLAYYDQLLPSVRGAAEKAESAASVSAGRSGQGA